VYLLVSHNYYSRPTSYPECFYGHKLPKLDQQSGTSSSQGLGAGVCYLTILILEMNGKEKYYVCREDKNSRTLPDDWYPLPPVFLFEGN